VSSLGIEHLIWPDAAIGIPQPLAFIRAISEDELRSMAEAATDSSLIEHHETLPFLDKLILARDPRTGTQLRLHRYTDLGTGDVHDHRWSFASRILTGAYEHRRFRATPESQIELVSSETVKAGTTYFIHWRELHSVTALELPTWTLILRGPPEQRAFRILGEDGSIVEKFGATDEAPSERQQKRMSPERLSELIDEFVATDIRPLTDGRHAERPAP
jgi:hypothetical protein